MYKKGCLWALLMINFTLRASRVSSAAHVLNGKFAGERLALLRATYRPIDNGIPVHCWRSSYPVTSAVVPIAMEQQVWNNK